MKIEFMETISSKGTFINHVDMKGRGEGVNRVNQMFFHIITLALYTY